MRIHQHKRQSTTARVTRSVFAAIAKRCNKYGEGVIVRHKGQELGVVNCHCVCGVRYFEVYAKYGERDRFAAKDCTIRKTTVTAIDHLDVFALYSVAI